MTATADEIPGIPATELEVMLTAVADFLESQGTAQRITYDWPKPQSQNTHFAEEDSASFRELTQPWELFPATRRERYNKLDGMHLMTYRAENA